MLKKNWLNIRSGFGGISGSLLSRPCKIAYLGNSVTAQKESYRILLHSHISAYCRQNHKPVNAGLGGIGSLACAFLVDDFVIRNHPEICFVECSTADIGGATPMPLIGPAVEGIVRQLLSKKINVCLLHVYRHQEMYHDPEAVLSCYEEIADRYKIPSINLHALITEMISEGRFTPEEIVYDGIHTTALGAKITAAKAFEGVEEILLSPPGLSFVTVPPIYDNMYQDTNVVPATGDMVVQKQNFTAGKFRNVLSYIEIFEATELKFTPIEGALVALLVIADKASGVVCVKSNNYISRIQLFDQWCDKERLQVIILEKAVPPNTEVSICLAEESTAQRGANTTPNHNAKKADSLKIIGFMVNPFTKGFKKNQLW